MLSNVLAYHNVKHVVVASNISELQPNTTLKLFHGMDVGTLKQFLAGGVDATKEMPRYHNQGDERGLYVTPSLKTALSFGSIVALLKVKGKQLYPTARWSLGSGRKTRTVLEMASDRYPKSFRPVVSLQLNETNEPQAMLIGFVPRSSIMAVYIQDKSGKLSKLSLEQASLTFDSKPRIKFDENSTALDILTEIASVEGYTIDELVDVLSEFKQEPEILRRTFAAFKLPRKLILRCMRYIMASEGTCE